MGLLSEMVCGGTGPGRSAGPGPHTRPSPAPARGEEWEAHVGASWLGITHPPAPTCEGPGSLAQSSSGSSAQGPTWLRPFPGHGCAFPSHLEICWVHLSSFQHPWAEPCVLGVRNSGDRERDAGGGGVPWLGRFCRGGSEGPWGGGRWGQRSTYTEVIPTWPAPSPLSRPHGVVRTEKSERRK